MLKLKLTKIFKKDLDRLIQNKFNTAEFNEIIIKLRNREPLEAKHKDHQLKGNLRDYRDCHIKDDLVLIYKIDNETLKLIAIDKHNNIFKKIPK